MVDTIIYEGDDEGDTKIGFHCDVIVKGNKDWDKIADWFMKDGEKSKEKILKYLYEHDFLELKIFFFRLIKGGKIVRIGKGEVNDNRL